MEQRVCLDQAGAAVPVPELLAAVAAGLPSLALANPHSRHAGATRDLVQAARMRFAALAAGPRGGCHSSECRVGEYLNARGYSVVFTSGATAGLKLLAEAFFFRIALPATRRASTSEDFRLEPAADVPSPSFVYGQVRQGRYGKPQANAWYGSRMPTRRWWACGKWCGSGGATAWPSAAFHSRSSSDAWLSPPTPPRPTLTSHIPQGSVQSRATMGAEDAVSSS